MIGKADAVVIGGGIMGASTAHFLTRLGFGQVALVEKRQDLRRLDAVLGRPRAAALLERGRDQARRARGGDDRERRGGPRRAFRLPPDRLPALRAARGARRRCATSSRCSRASASRHRRSSSRPRSRAAGRSSGSRASRSPVTSRPPGSRTPCRRSSRSSRSAQRDGLHVYEGCEVLAISTANGRVTGVVTGEGEIATRVVVNAAGPWSDRIGRMAGVDYPLDVQPGARGDVRRPRGLRGLPGHLGRAAGLYCRPYRRQGPRRRRLAEAEGAGRSRDLRRRHRRRAREQDGAAADPPRCPRSGRPSRRRTTAARS